MSEYAVIKISGSQYKVQKDNELVVDRLSEKKGAKVLFDKVLLLVGSGKVEVGTPIVAGASVEAKVVGHEKGEKIRVFRFKAKSRYRKTKGFRPSLTRIIIEEIKKSESGQKKTSR